MTKNSNFESTPVNKHPQFSIIIPVRAVNPILRETQKKLLKQTYRNFEVIVITDKDLAKTKGSNLGPAFKRNLGAKLSRGKYLVFLDDDSYPASTYLENANRLIQKNKNIALCGPQLTPAKNNLKQKASGYILSSMIGSGGAGRYRNLPSKARYVNDYPSVNLIVKKSVFEKIGGFNIKYWPGEDTLLCRSLINIDKQAIYYHPSLVVYHHRREVGIDFLKQHSRYGLHRGYFAKRYPENSAKIGYFLPSIFIIYLLILTLFSHRLLLIPLIAYTILLSAETISVLAKSRSPILALLFFIYIPLTHVIYGLYFIKGIFSRKLTFIPHKINKQNGGYVGG